jgi:hypothetical protein
MVGAALRAHVRCCPQDCASARPARPARQQRRSYGLHSGDSGGGLEPADIEGAPSRSHGPAAERPALGLGEPESTHRWTGTTCQAAPLACSDWSEERDGGRSRLDRVEGGGDNGKPGRTGLHPRLAVTGVLICAVVALVITPRDIISHRFTLSLFMRLRHQSPITLQWTITSDTPTASLWQAMYGFTHAALRVRSPGLACCVAGWSPPGGRARSESVLVPCTMLAWPVSIELIDVPFSHLSNGTIKHLTHEVIRNGEIKSIKVSTTSQARS